MYREPRRFETYPFESESAYAATRLKTCQVRVPGPLRLACGTLRAAWNGEIVLMARRAGLADLSRRFDITWFLGAIHKYRRLLGEVCWSPRSAQADQAA